MGSSLPCKLLCDKALIIAAPPSLCVKAEEEVLPGPVRHKARQKAPHATVDPEHFLGPHVRPFEGHHTGQLSEPEDPLVAALRHGDLDGVKTCLGGDASRGANRRSSRQQTPLMLAASAALPGDDHVRELCELLLDAQAEVEAIDEKGWTPLMHACSSNNVSTVELLLERGASIHRCDYEGRSCLMLAFIGSEDLKLLKSLVELKASVESRDAKGWSLLFYACEQQNLHVIRWLCNKFQADLETRALDGLTPADILKRQGLGQAHRWLGARRRPEMEYLLIDLGLMNEDGHPLPLESEPNVGSRRRSSKSQKGESGESRRSSKVSVGSDPRHGESRRSSKVSIGSDPKHHGQHRRMSKGSDASHPSSRRSSKGAFAPEHLEETDCTAVVTVHVAADGRQTRDVFIPEPAKPNVAGLHDEEACQTPERRWTAARLPWLPADCCGHARSRR
ncbi:unnamed protein product [Durusdinium trenchii]|uniref:Uncharacterized protein n=1 Tax=Durusdinium trenchii TaxID=1381693 RepID=A0ABP0I1G7_9DINO